MKPRKRDLLAKLEEARLDRNEMAHELADLKALMGYRFVVSKFTMAPVTTDFTVDGEDVAEELRGEWVAVRSEPTTVELVNVDLESLGILARMGVADVIGGASGFYLLECPGLSVQVRRG